MIECIESVLPTDTQQIQITDRDEQSDFDISIQIIIIMTTNIILLIYSCW
jgi:hypothetical protein